MGKVIDVANQYSHFPIEVDIGPSGLMERAEALDISHAKQGWNHRPEFSLEYGIKKNTLIGSKRLNMEINSDAFRNG